MIERFIVVLGQLSTLFLLMGVGFVLTRLRLLTERGTKEMSALLVNVVTPCVIIGAFPATPDPALLGELGRLAVALTLCYIAYALAAQLFFRGSEPGHRGLLRFGCVYGNVGFMGIPLLQAVLGQEALVVAAITLAVYNVMAFTHGAVLVGGKEALSPRKAVLNPGVIGVAIGLPLFLTGAVLPGPVARTVSFLGDLNTPLAMVVIGAQLARADLGAVLRETRPYAVAGVKLLLIPLLTAGVLLPFGLSPMFYIAAVILAATPTAGYTSIFAERYGGDTAQAAQLVSLGHLLSVVTLPLMAVVAEALAALA